MQEQIITFKTAKLLKSKGFDFEKETDTNIVWLYNKKGDFVSSIDEEVIYGISQSLLQKWLREKYEIFVQPFYDDPEWRIAICDPEENSLGEYEQKENMTYEEALELGLQEALKLI